MMLRIIRFLGPQLEVVIADQLTCLRLHLLIDQQIEILLHVAGGY